MTTELLVEAVRSVLSKKAREGSTTKSDAVLMVHGKIEKAGGPTKFGIGAAAMRMALLHIIGNEVSRQFKLGLTEHEFKHVLPANTPMEVIAALGRTPRWIAIEDGSEATWVYALQATPEQWLKNATMKEKKAQQTKDKARESQDIALFLIGNRFASLAEALSQGV